MADLFPFIIMEISFLIYTFFKPTFSGTQPGWQSLGVLHYFPDVSKACQREQSVFRIEKRNEKIFTHERNTMSLFTAVYWIIPFKQLFITIYFMCWHGENVDFSPLGYYIAAVW